MDSWWNLSSLSTIWVLPINVFCLIDQLGLSAQDLWHEIMMKGKKRSYVCSEVHWLWSYLLSFPAIRCGICLERKATLSLTFSRAILSQGYFGNSYCIKVPFSHTRLPITSSKIALKLSLNRNKMTMKFYLILYLMNIHSIVFTSIWGTMANKFWGSESKNMLFFTLRMRLLQCSITC